MGDRAQIKIEDTGIYLYTHWDGVNLPNVLKNALLRKQRWDDVEYLTRIIFSEMIKDCINDETGYGIGNSEHGDLNNPLIIVNCEKQTVSIEDEKYSFNDFINKQ